MIKSGPLNILIVDHNPASAQDLVAYMRVFGYDAKSVGSVAEALRALRESPSVHVVITDVQIGVESGLSLLTDIKQNFHGIPHVFMMAQSQPENLKELFAKGAEGFLLKPFQARTLLDVVRKAMMSSRQRWSVLPGSEPVHTLTDASDLRLGKGGFSISTQAALPNPGTPLTVNIQIGDIEIRGVALLRWKTVSNAALCRAGLEFQYLEPSSLASVLTALELVPDETFIPAA